MNRIKRLEKKLDAVLDYLGIDLEYREGYEINKNKQEIGFCEKKKRL